jgi:hypothetical protein
VWLYIKKCNEGLKDEKEVLVSKFTPKEALKTAPTSRFGEEDKIRVEEPEIC